MAKKKIHKMFYSMGEVSEMFDVNSSLIRYWEGKFDILRPHKNKKGNRMFTPEDVDNLKIIYHLVKEKGMTLEGADRRIKSNKEAISRDMDLVDRLLAVKSTLMEIKQELNVGRDGTLDQRDDYDAVQAPYIAPKVEQEREQTAEQNEEEFSDFDAEQVECTDEEVTDLFAYPQSEDEEQEDFTEERINDEEFFTDLDLVANRVLEVVDTEQMDIDLEPEYIAHLSEQIAEEAEIAAEVMETLAAIDGDKQEEKKPEVYEQTLF